MDAAKKKALFRAKLNAQKKDKRINSPLVRYNESDQPVCRVCNVVLKSESLWDAHQASRKHHEAINNIKAGAVGHSVANSTKPEARNAESTRPHNVELHDTKFEPSTKLAKPQTSSGLPADFFDNNKAEINLPKHARNSGLGDKRLEPSEKSSKHQSSSVLPPNFFDAPEAKRQKTDSAKSSSLNSHKKLGNSAHTKVETLLEDEMDRLPTGNDVQGKITGHAKDFIHAPDITGSGTDMKHVKGALPEGFFDDKEADLRARGIKLVKPDVKDEYKEFEKLIQEDLLEVDDRLEEEEIDAAEMIEEAETVEQKTYREKVELLRKKKMELIAARSTKHGRESGKKSSNEESSSSDDDGDDENFAVDWRAQHL